MDLLPVQNKKKKSLALSGQRRAQPNLGKFRPHGNVACGELAPRLRLPSCVKCECDVGFDFHKAN